MLLNPARKLLMLLGPQAAKTIYVNHVVKQYCPTDTSEKLKNDDGYI